MFLQTSPCFLQSQKTFRFGLFLKGPKCCTLHMQVRRRGLPGEWMTEKQGLGAGRAGRRAGSIRALTSQLPRPQ